MFILSNKNTMIIIKLSSKIKHITENKYEKIIQFLNFNELSCPKCNSKGLRALLIVAMSIYLNVVIKSQYKD